MKITRTVTAEEKYLAKTLYDAIHNERYKELTADQITRLAIAICGTMRAKAQLTELQRKREELEEKYQEIEKTERELGIEI